MSEQNNEAPSYAEVADPAKPTDVTSTPKHVSAPSNVTGPSSSVSSLGKQLDRAILRLNQVISTPGGLNSFLSTFNYTLYILAYLQTTHSHTIKRHARTLLVLLNYGRSKPDATILVTDAGAVPPVAALAGLISRARTTLRLFGLFPLYAWLKALLKGKKEGEDPVLHRVALLQCISYIVYQALENIAVLGDNGVLSPSTISRFNKGDSTTTRIYLWAYRAWLAGVTCDFLSLARRAQREKEKREKRGSASQEEIEEDRKTDSGWWREFVVAAAWFPMALHYSGEKGIPGWNLGWLGVTGWVAGLGRTKGYWDATA
ncbi:hypothetical protein GQ43DRAFT_438761 [Delitschia confertaspora ATCC 74209]|uniref:Uncharacterized protein n=1 Tax=Delitschia confertaspora ATCC 74209 TaxID=1513339 RepID=A0A9P4MUX5_9PLEO|nr:hypothetical protein GQ43DRAFT_438761 [Delitschia confertaspora ATCC 74209]